MVPEGGTRGVYVSGDWEVGIFNSILSIYSLSNNGKRLPTPCRLLTLLEVKTSTLLVSLQYLVYRSYCTILFISVFSQAGL